MVWQGSPPSILTSAARDCRITPCPGCVRGRLPGNHSSVRGSYVTSLAAVPVLSLCLTTVRLHVAAFVFAPLTVG